DGRVVEDDRGGLAAELEREATEAFAAQRADASSDGRAPGEGDLVDVRMGDEVLADLPSGGDNVDHTLRHAGFDGALREHVRVERRLGRRLDDDGATRGHGRTELEHRHEERDVP